MRVTAGFSQEDVASVLGVAQSSISLWERDKFQPKLDKVKQLADLYDVSVLDIIDACTSNKHEPIVNGKEGLDNEQGLRHAIQNQQKQCGFDAGTGSGNALCGNWPASCRKNAVGV